MERNIHVLLILLRNNCRVTKSWFGLKQRIDSGLCIELDYICYGKNLINKYECSVLYSYILHNRPIWVTLKTYGWKPTLWIPRKRWLNKHIKLTYNDK